MTLQIIVQYLFYQCLENFLKKVMPSRLLDFLNSKHFFHNFQFGFRAKHSTEHAYATLLNYLHSALDSSLMTAALFSMFEKHLTH